MKIEIKFDNGKTGEANCGFVMENVGTKERCLQVLNAVKEAIESLD